MSDSRFQAPTSNPAELFPLADLLIPPTRVLLAFPDIPTKTESGVIIAESAVASFTREQMGKGFILLGQGESVNPKAPIGCRAQLEPNAYMHGAQSPIFAHGDPVDGWQLYSVDSVYVALYHPDGILVKTPRDPGPMPNRNNSGGGRVIAAGTAA